MDVVLGPRVNAFSHRRPRGRLSTRAEALLELWSQERWAGQATVENCEVSRVIAGTPPFPLASPFSTHFPPLSFQLLISQGIVQQKKSRPEIRGASPRLQLSKYALPTAPPPSLKQTRERIPYISKDKRAHIEILAFGPSPLSPTSLGPRVWSRLPASPGVFERFKSASDQDSCLVDGSHWNHKL